MQSRDQLLRDVWEYNTLIDTRTVDTHMRRLREKLGPAAKHLDTVRGVGYRFVETRRLRHASRPHAHERDQRPQHALEFQTQQEVLFNSMVEGLLLLDERGRIQLANRAFANLFGVTADIRGRTLMEALRLHELAELVNSLDTQKQVLGFELKLPGLSERWLQINAAAIFNGQRRAPWHRAGLPRFDPPEAARERPPGVRRQRQP